MSTKTTIKRVALVAVSVMGLGLLPMAAGNAAAGVAVSTSLPTKGADTNVLIGASATSVVGATIGSALVAADDQVYTGTTITLSVPAGSSVTLADNNGSIADGAAAFSVAGATGSSGLSKAYYRLLDADLYLATDESTVVGRISDVPAGKYLVMFNTDLINFGAGQYFGCGFEAQGGGGAGKVYIEPNFINGGVLFESRYNYSKNGYIGIEVGFGTIEVHCKVNGNPGPFTFGLSNGSLIALALNDVTTSFRVFPNP